MSSSREYVSPSMKAKRGARLKKLAKERGLTGEAMMELLQYQGDVHYIYTIYSGDRGLPVWRYEILSDAWGLRMEYLLCNDDHPTDEDLFRYHRVSHRISRSATYGVQRSYLSSLGIEITPVYCWKCNGAVLLHGYDRFKRYFSPVGKRDADRVLSRWFADDPREQEKIFRQLQMDDSSPVVAQHGKRLFGINEVQHLIELRDSIAINFVDAENVWCELFEGGDESSDSFDYSAAIHMDDLEVAHEMEKISFEIVLFRVVIGDRSVGYCSLDQAAAFFALIDGNCKLLARELFENMQLLTALSSSSRDSVLSDFRRHHRSMISE